jgi:uncharacterized caspase-like protein
MARNPDHHAIVIGIDTYSQLHRLRGSVNDARLFAEWLMKEDGGGLPEENVHLILSPPDLPSDPFEARPVAYQIDRALTRIGLTRPARLGAKRLYFYFAGHGFGPEFDDVGMLMANASDPDRLANTYNIGLRPFRLFFRKTEAFDEIIFILDCCRDPLVNVDTGIPGIKPGYEGTGVSVRDFVVMAAAYGAKAFQKPPVDKDKPHGILTTAILEALEKPDAADGLGRFTASSLFDYVSKRIKNIGEDPKLRQIPEVYNPKTNPEIIFSTIPESKLERVETWISVAPQYTGELILKDNHGIVITKTSAAGLTKQNPWKVYLIRNRWYALAHSDGMTESPSLILRDLDQVPNPYQVTFQ